MGEGPTHTTAAKRTWKQDPDAVRANILEVATKVFAENGLSGARVDEIAARTATSKRMIYYYFGDKEGLYRATLERAYAKVRKAEDTLDLGSLDPIEALRRLTEFTFDHHRSAEDFVRLVMIENIHGAEHILPSEEIAGQNSSAIRHLEEIYARGCEQGSFRRGLSALELHWHISALCLFNVSNRPTFSRIFGDALFDARGQQMLRRHVGDMILRFVMRTDRAEADKADSEIDTRKIDPELERFLVAWEAKWAILPPGAGPADRRAHFEAVARDMRMPTPEDVETDAEHWIDSESGPVRVRIFRHISGGVQPALIYMHGGAWIQGSPETHWDITARIASWNRQSVISVDYALAPEAPYPAAVNQVAAVAQWAGREAETLGIDPERIAIGGDGAGGNLAAAVTLKLRETRPAFTGQLLIYPACDFDQTRPSMVENAAGPLIKVVEMDEINAAYSPDNSRLCSEPLVAPLVAETHAGLPPAYIAVAQYDPLRDSGTAYAEALEKAGVPVTLDSREGLIHGYLRAMQYCAASRGALERMCAWLGVRNAA